VRRQAEQIPFGSDAFEAVAAALARRGLVWECNGPETHPLALETVLTGIFNTATANPTLTVVVDHCGGAVGPACWRSDSAAHAKWKRCLAKLATLPNVYMKVGGLQMPLNGFGLAPIEGRTGPPVTSDELLKLTFPIYSYVIEQFGPKRCMFESNFPVDKQSVSYCVLWNTFKKVAAKMLLSDEAKRHIFHDTAVNVYKLKLT
jgi:predicted TIM-barrel fold metal-dependent hydrolase